MRRLAAAALPLSVLLLTAACGADDDSDVPPELGSTPSATPSSSPSSSPSDAPSASTGTTAFDDQGHDVVPGTIAAGNAKQKAVADAWLAYWKVRIDSYGTAKADPTAIGQVASGEAASNIVKYVAYLNQKKLHTVGDIKVGVSKVQLTGGGLAAVVSCTDNKSVDRHEDGRPAEELTRWAQFAGVLKQTGGTWVVQQSIKTSNEKCQV